MIDIDNFIDLEDIDEIHYKDIFGSGYRYCCYTIANRNFSRDGSARSTGQGIILFFGYDKNGNPCNYRVPHKSHIKYTVKYKTQEKDVFGNYVETKYFDNTMDRKSFIDNFPDKKNIVECLQPQNEFLHKQYVFVYLLFNI